jgi:hypothetical protein
MDAGRVVMTDFSEAGTTYVHHTQVPIAIAGYTLVSPVFARGRFPKFSFIDLIHKRPAMDEDDVVAFATVCGIQVQPPFWGNGVPFGKHLWDVIDRYGLEPFFERVPRPFGGSGDHFLMRPRGFAWTQDFEPEIPGELAKWRAAYRKLDTAHQLMVATVLQLYRQGEDKLWMVRVPKTWHAAEGIAALQEAGFLADWARLYALYPGW